MWKTQTGWNIARIKQLWLFLLAKIIYIQFSLIIIYNEDNKRYSIFNHIILVCNTKQYSIIRTHFSKQTTMVKSAKPSENWNFKDDFVGSQRKKKCLLVWPPKMWTFWIMIFFITLNIFPQSCVQFHFSRYILSLVLGRGVAKNFNSTILIPNSVS